MKQTRSLPARQKPAPAEAVACGTAQAFRATLEPDHTSLHWVIARVPFDVGKTWSNMIRLRVRGSVNGHPFRTSLFPMPAGQPGHFLLVNRGMQSAAGVRVGMAADFLLEPDLEARSATLPAELVDAFEGDPDLLRFAESFSDSVRREFAKWINGVKGPDAQARRCAQLAERLLLAMEGERHTPPILEALFGNTPRARAGWHALTPGKRRGHLLGIFYYQTPEARTRRAQKAVEDAIRAAEKASVR